MGAPTETSFPSALTPRRSTFGSLGVRNFRLMAASQLLSNTGWWMQITAQSWLVLNLTGSPAAVGLTAALAYLPSLMLGMAGGMLADRYPKRWLVLANYAGWASLTALLAGLTLSHIVQAWMVQLIAAGLGTVTALCWPAQQAFVGEMVGPGQLRNAISIMSSVVQLAGLVGPALGGLLISARGPGESFLIAAIGYTVPVVAVTQIRARELLALPPGRPERGQLRAALRYAASRPDVLWPITLVGLFAMFTGNLPVTLAVYANSVFGSGPGGYGLLSATVAVGSVIGALISARQHQTRLRTLVLYAALLSVLFALSAAAPQQLTFCALMLGVGASGLLLQTSANSVVQLAAPAAIRGRIMSLYAIAWFGGIAIGGPLLGYIDQYAVPQAGMLLAGMLPGMATLLIAARLTIHSRNSGGGAVTPPVAAFPAQSPGRGDLLRQPK
nr:MFS transporter [Sinomonas humi]